ncbi:methionine--tRNA ligase [Caldiplasma sukawensis]
MKETVIINCALPYANNSLHIGHIAGAYLSGDIFNRFSKLNGKRTIFISGSDEYGTPIALKAEKEKKSPKEIAEKFHKEHFETFKRLGIFFDNFGETMDPLHQETVNYFYKILKERGYLYRKNVTSAYCPTEKRFLPDRYVNGTCPNCGNVNARGDQCDECGRTYDPQELIKPYCAICGSDAEFRDTEHIFFRISSLQDEIVSWLSGKKDWRKNVRDFSLNISSGGLIDRSITRDMDWGVKVPEDDMKEKRIYVWFEALLGYITNIRRYLNDTDNMNEWKKLYESSKLYYFMGKDNIFFHSIFLPGIFMASGMDFLPERVTANEYLRFKGEKFSKSKGIGYTVNEILQIIPPDYLRYYLSSILPENSDSDFSLEELENKVNSELIGKYGNLVNRVLSFSSGKSIMPEHNEERCLSGSIVEDGKKFLSDYIKNMGKLEFRKSLDIWLDFVKRANQYVNDGKPWELIKNDPVACSDLLYHAMESIDLLTVTLHPFVPFSTEEIWFSMHQEKFPREFGEMDNFKKYRIEQRKVPFEKLSLPKDDQVDVDLVVGRVIDAEIHPDADRLLHLKVSLGDGEIELVAGLRAYYSPESIRGKKIIVVKNLKHSKIRGIESQGMLLAAQDENGAHILTTDEPEGTHVTFGNLKFSGVSKIDIENLYSYELRVEEIGGKIVPTAKVGRERLPFLANGKMAIFVDGKVSPRSIIK